MDFHFKKDSKLNFLKCKRISIMIRPKMPISQMKLMIRNMLKIQTEWIRRTEWKTNKNLKNWI